MMEDVLFILVFFFIWQNLTNIMKFKSEDKHFLFIGLRKKNSNYVQILSLLPNP